MYSKVVKPLLILVAPLAVSSACLAGTGGIFPTTNQNQSSSSPLPGNATSPGSAGVWPASSLPTNQSSSPVLRGLNNAPVPGNAAIPVNATTPGSAGFQPASGAAETNLPLRGLPTKAPAGQLTNAQPLSGSATRGLEAGGKPALQQSQSPVLPQGTVESFFQVSPAQRSARPTASSSDATKLSEDQDDHKKSVKRFLWHTLDNIGVPMFFGNKDDDLDPSLAHGYIMRSENGARAAQTPNKDNATANSAVINQPSVHKIPDSELEGVNFSVKNDAQSATP